MKFAEEEKKKKKKQGLFFFFCKVIVIKVKIKGQQRTSASLTTLKPLTVWITTNCGKFFMRWKYQTTLPAS